MNYKSSIKCDCVANRIGKAPEPCTKGAEYFYKGKHVCRSHLSQMVTDDYVAEHPECQLAVEVRVGTKTYRLSREKAERLRDLLKDEGP